jgi:hypothetical protein
MSKLVKSKERQQKFAEVYTPDFIVQRMLNMVPEEIWDDPTKTFMEPACGSGNFIVAIIRRKIDHGSTIEQAISTTYGVDILEDNIAECHQRVYEEFISWMDDKDRLKQIIKTNIICKDFLKP